MQKHAVILGGFESVYMQKLALYLSGRMGDRVQVVIANAVLPEAEADTVWIGSEVFLEEVREREADAQCILLSETDDAETGVYRYQSCEKLYQQIISRYRRLTGASEDGAQAGRQRWVVLTTDGAAASLLAFSVTCAQILGGRGRVLYLNFSECSGMAELFMLEPGTDLSDLIEALRKGEPACLEACVRQMEQIDYIMPPVNPMILHEIRDHDADRLIAEVGRREEYAYVVIALGDTCCGCDRFFRRAWRAFHLTDKDPLRACSQREWMEFYARCVGGEEAGPERICLPPIAAESSGFHLIHIWQDGALGQLARIYLDGEENA